MEVFCSAIQNLSPILQELLGQIPPSLQKECREVRLRRGLPVVLICGNYSYCLTTNGGTTMRQDQPLFCLSEEETERNFCCLCEHSVYSHQQEIVQGFLSLKGGHRAGVCGTAVIQNGKIVALRHITSISIRIARQIDHVADDLLQKELWQDHCGFLLAGIPASGKTTLLRDLGKQASLGALGQPLRVAVIDERGEISGGDSLGWCDILQGYPKAEGIQQAIRCLSPQLILCDEIGTVEECRQMADGFHSGIKTVATVHAGSPEEFCRRSVGKYLRKTQAFSHIVFLQGRNAPGKIRTIIKTEDLPCENHGNDLAFFIGNPLGNRAVSNAVSPSRRNTKELGIDSAAGTANPLSADSALGASPLL